MCACVRACVCHEAMEGVAVTVCVRACVRACVCHEAMEGVAVTVCVRACVCVPRGNGRCCCNS